MPKKSLQKYPSLAIANGCHTSYAGKGFLRRAEGHHTDGYLAEDMREEFLALIENRKRNTFLLVCLLALVLLFLKKSFIEDRTAAFEFLAERPEGSALVLRSALQYVSIPLIYLWKFTVVGFVVWVGCFTMGYRITFGRCWRVVMASELIWFIPEALKLMYFLFIVTSPDYFLIQAFYPFSLMNLADHTTLDAAWHYPFKSINLFEPIYGAVMAYGLASVSGRSFQEMAIVMLVSYLPLMLIWLAFWVMVYR